METRIECASLLRAAEERKRSDSILSAIRSILCEFYFFRISSKFEQIVWNFWNLLILPRLPRSALCPSEVHSETVISQAPKGYFLINLAIRLLSRLSVNPYFLHTAITGNLNCEFSAAGVFVGQKDVLGLSWCHISKVPIFFLMLYFFQGTLPPSLHS